MGPAQSALLGLGATAGIAANKVAGGMQDLKNNDKLGTKELKAQLAEMKSNQGIIDEYTTVKTNLLRTKAMQVKRGTWSEKHEKQVAFAEAMIERFSKANDDIMGKMKNTLSKKPGGEK